MLPDLRFLVGAVLATALLAVAGLGLLSAVKIAQQARISPLEASRSLAFAPEQHRPPLPDTTPRFGMSLPDDPFANLPRGTAPDVLAAPAIVASEIIAAPEVVAQAPALSAAPEIPAAPEAVTSPPDDADSVDERAVVDPPLPADEERTETTAEPSAAPPAEVEHVGSLPPAAAATDPPAAEPALADTPDATATPDAPIADADIADTLGGDLATSPAPNAAAQAKSPRSQETCRQEESRSQESRRQKGQGEGEGAQGPHRRAAAACVERLSDHVRAAGAARHRRR